MTTEPITITGAQVIDATKDSASGTTSWRDVVKIHPAAEMFPRLLDGELRELAEDIKQVGQRVPVAVFHPDLDFEQLLDGRSRLDAMQLAGLPIVKNSALDRDVVMVEDIQANVDPYAYVVSVNIHRRHLSAEKKRELIGTLLKAKPEQSNRAIAKLAKADDKTVASVRRGLEATAEIPQLGKTIGADKKGRSTTRKTNSANGTGRVVADEHDRGDERPGGGADDHNGDVRDRGDDHPGGDGAENGLRQVGQHDLHDGRDQHDRGAAAAAAPEKTSAAAEIKTAPVAEAAKSTILELLREATPKERRDALAAILESLDVQELVDVLPVHLRNGLEARLLRLRGLQRSTQLTKLLKTALGSRSPAEQITSLGRMNEALTKEKLTGNDVHVRVPK